MSNILKPLKVAAVAAVASYVVMNELESRFGFKSDVQLMRKILGLRRTFMEGLAKRKTIADVWYETLKQVGPEKKAIIFVDDDGSTRTFTFGDLEAFSNRIANFLTQQGMKTGDTVALLMENRPEFIGTWLGAAKMGVLVAMINTSIVKKGLCHCINVSGAKGVIYGKELEEPLSEVVGDLNGVAKLYCQGGAPSIPGAHDLDSALKSCLATIANEGRDQRRGIDFTSHWGYIYTSVSIFGVSYE